MKILEKFASCCYLVFLPISALPLTYNCQQGVNCHLPDCFCSTFEHPMQRKDIPQMVYFGFDASVNSAQAQYYDDIFRSNRLNPNGCPIGITLYVSDKNTDYDIVNGYHDREFELGVHGINHTPANTRDKVLEEAGSQRNNLITQAGIPKGEVLGWRSPNLLTAGDEQIEVLTELGFTYDISLTYTRTSMNASDVWPFTLDYGWPFKTGCNPQCPKKEHKGFWQVPVNSMILDKYPCIYVDGCYKRPSNVEEGYKFLTDNFRSHYYGNRAPFGINMHSEWLYSPHNLEAIDRAIHDMLKHDDVYIITVKQVIEWMKNPTKISELREFSPWNCKLEHKRHHKQRGFTTAEIGTGTGLMSVIIIVVSTSVAIAFGFAIRKIMTISKNSQYFVLENFNHFRK